MSIRKPNLGAAGRGELDEPLKPPGIGPADRGALAGDPRWPVGTPPKKQPAGTPPVRQPVGGSVDQPLGTEEDRQHPERQRPGAERQRSPDEIEIGDPEREDDRREDTNGGFDEP